uniref:Uncharacterized protein n=1 Tax=Arcella intermedia TaxID=1963864 RepID=A0A6B2LU87_9EUKA
MAPSSMVTSLILQETEMILLLLDLAKVKLLKDGMLGLLLCLEVKEQG